MGVRPALLALAVEARQTAHALPSPDSRRYLLCAARTGCPWRYLPSNFPAWQAVYYHFRQFRRKNTLHALYTALHRAERERVGRHADPSAGVMVSQSMKTVEESDGIRGYDAHKCVKGRKRHLLVDTLGLPIAGT